MILPDVNVLVYAHRRDAADHDRYREWMVAIQGGAASYALSGLVLSAFIRIVTNPRVLRDPTPLLQALAFASEVRDQENCVVITPGARQWQIFADLCVSVSARGNMIPDAYLAALAIESGCEWVTTDRDYARFPGLRWRHPLAEKGA